MQISKHILLAIFFGKLKTDQTMDKDVLAIVYVAFANDLVRRTYVKMFSVKYMAIAPFPLLTLNARYG